MFLHSCMGSTISCQFLTLCHMFVEWINWTHEESLDTMATMQSLITGEYVLTKMQVLTLTLLCTLVLYSFHLWHFPMIWTYTVLQEGFRIMVYTVPIVFDTATFKLIPT